MIRDTSSFCICRGIYVKWHPSSDFHRAVFMKRHPSSDIRQAHHELLRPAHPRTSTRHPHTHLRSQARSDRQRQLAPARTGVARGVAARSLAQQGGAPKGRGGDCKVICVCASGLWAVSLYKSRTLFFFFLHVVGWVGLDWSGMD